MINTSALDYYDFHARNYDAQLGRWNSPDILMGMYSSESPYSFSGNNPVNNVDPSGMNYQTSMCNTHSDGGFMYRGSYTRCGNGGGGSSYGGSNVGRNNPGSSSDDFS